MSSAKIYPFPSSALRRHAPLRPLRPVRYVIRLDSSFRSAGFGLLLCATLVGALLYLSETVSVPQHDILYTGLLAAVWACYFAAGPLLRMRLLGPTLARAGQVFVVAGTVSFFGFVYWLILSR